MSRHIKLTCLISVFILLLSGCVTITSPDKPVKINKDAVLEDFQGVYLNKGDPEQYLSKHFMNRTIRNADGESLHWSDIEFVGLEISDESLIFSAVFEGCVISSEEYEPGKHFEIKGSKIALDDDIDPLHESLIGVTTLKQSFELDVNGSLIFNTRYSVIGTLLVIPIVGAGIEQIIFRRQDTQTKFEPCE